MVSIQVFRQCFLDLCLNVLHLGICLFKRLRIDIHLVFDDDIDFRDILANIEAVSDEHKH